jgi:hypothetical protein
MALSAYLSPSKAARKAAYCRDVERLVVAARPDVAGRMDWDDVLYHFHYGHSVEEAVAAILSH